MKNKKGLSRIMVIVVAGLWAYNIYRTIQNHQLKNESVQSSEEQFTNIPPVLYNKDSFDLELPRLDPFLQKRTDRRTNSTLVSNNPTSHSQRNSNQRRSTKQNGVSNPNYQWPKISYLGFVRNHNTDHQLCLLNVNGKLEKLAIGETFAGLVLTAAWKDSVQVSHEELVKVIGR